MVSCATWGPFRPVPWMSLLPLMSWRGWLFSFASNHLNLLVLFPCHQLLHINLLLHLPLLSLPPILTLLFLLLTPSPHLILNLPPLPPPSLLLPPLISPSSPSSSKSLETHPTSNSGSHSTTATPSSASSSILPSALPPTTTSSLPSSFSLPPDLSTGPLEGSTTSQSIRRIVKKVPNPFQVIPDTTEMLELVHMIDTGGQPEHMENMPSLVHSCHLAVLVMNLQYGVDDYPSIHYHQDGKKYGRALPSQYSTRQIIQKLASTLQAKRYSQKEGQVFRLLVVATHRDCLWPWQKKGRINEYDQALREILLPACDKELIQFSATQILFDLNLKRPSREDQEKLTLIREKISESGVGEVVKTPVSFLLFEQELMELSVKMVGRFILSLDECLEVGAKLKMNLGDGSSCLDLLPPPIHLPLLPSRSP